MTRKVWSGLGVNEAPISQKPIRKWVTKICKGLIIPLNVDAHINLVINGHFSITHGKYACYGIGPNHELWTSSVCIPLPSILQWAAKFNIDMVGDYTLTDGVITAEIEKPYILVEWKSSQSISWLGSTLDSYAYLPATFLDNPKAVLFMLHLSIEDWQRMTACHSDATVNVSQIAQSYELK